MEEMAPRMRRVPRLTLPKEFLLRMCAKLVAFLVTPLLIAEASAQSSGTTTLDRTLRLQNTDASKFATVIRSIGDMRNVSVDPEQNTIDLTGTADQLRLAEWLLNTLEQSATLPPSPPANEYRLLHDRDSFVHLYFLQHMATPLERIEFATLSRIIGEFPRVIVYDPKQAIVFRGTAEQAALADWLVHELDQPAATQPRPGDPPHGYQLTSGPENIVRVFYLPASETPRRLLELTSQIRRDTGVRRLFACGAQHAIAVRGTPDQIIATERLMQQQTQ